MLLIVILTYIFAHTTPPLLIAVSLWAWFAAHQLLTIILVILLA